MSIAQRSGTPIVLSGRRTYLRATNNCSKASRNDAIPDEIEMVFESTIQTEEEGAIFSKNQSSDLTDM